MSETKPTAVTDGEFRQAVLESEVPVLVDFWAPWCGPCKTVAPVVEEIAGEYAGRLRVVKVNTDESQEHAFRYGVRSIPTLILFRGGEEVDRMVGVLPKATLKERIQAGLGGS